ncbi:DUF3311 domain-containing protein [Micromonospora echinospora]|uniref:DUF3311 domain-containing protein n=1 Tax=Micromonospora echinospora TaxID=1877 RepID=UPI0037B00990
MAATEPEPPPPTRRPTTVRSRAKDHSPWNWLLFVPIVVPLIPVLFNGDSPRVFGFPRFYWLQLAYILLGVATTTLVYQMTKKRGDH